LIDEFGPFGLGQPHHVGIIVPDLSSAMKDMAGVGEWVELPLRKPNVPTAGLPRLIRSTAEVALRGAFSRIGPPHFELLERVPGTIWDGPEEAQLHHVAYWVPAERLEELSRHLESLGMRLEATRLDATGTKIRGVYHRWRTGMRIELLDWGLPGDVLSAGTR
jgi:hypothetical protein